MRQLIARIDEALHDRLKRRAAREGRSVNALVTEILAGALAELEGRAEVVRWLDATGLRVLPPRPRRVPSRSAVIALTRGAGRAASAALEAERAAR